MQLLEHDLLYTIVGYGQADRFVKIARSEGATGATAFPVEGSTSSVILKALGLGKKEREAVLVLTDESKAERMIEKAKADTRLAGVCILMGEEEGKKMEKKFTMITIIVNSGYADDVMDAARKAGATGGTITHARGTAPNDAAERFLNITIVPEKEMIMIVAEQDKAPAIVKAIQELKCLQQPGIGIIYTQEIKKFVNLGNK